MLIVSNGTPRSGSTWLYAIVKALVDSKPLPKPYQDRSWGKAAGASIHLYRMNRFLTEVNINTEYYVSKNHIISKKVRDQLLGHPKVRVLDINRDIKDSVTSYYYYQRNKRRFFNDFERYYWMFGRYFAMYIKEYRKIWQYKEYDNFYVTTYEDLLNKFYEECQKIANFIGLEIIEKNLELVQKKTSIKNMRIERGESNKPTEQRFFRKGVAGDWHNYFDEDMLIDIQNIDMEGPHGLDKIWYHILFPARIILRNYFAYLK